MKTNPNIWLTVLGIVGFVLTANATTKSGTSIDYTVKKDSLETNHAPDTTQPVIVFPNPFITIWGSEPKK